MSSSDQSKFSPPNTASSPTTSYSRHPKVNIPQMNRNSMPSTSSDFLQQSPVQPLHHTITREELNAYRQLPTASSPITLPQQIQPITFDKKEKMKRKDYDFILQINDMVDLWDQGWEITVNNEQMIDTLQLILEDETLYEDGFLSQEGIDLVNSEVFSRQIKTTDSDVTMAPYNFVAFQGTFNSGKTFIINHITDNNYASGEDVDTKGIR